MFSPQTPVKETKKANSRHLSPDSDPGFTLVELVIVVCIIGTLAAIAIPNFVEMQYRAKRAELPANIRGIKTAEMAYEAAFDQFVACADHPGHDLKKKVVPWGGGNEDFQALGWAPDGHVRASYEVTTTADGGDFTVRGRFDIDGDGVEGLYTATKSTSVTVVVED